MTSHLTLLRGLLQTPVIVPGTGERLPPYVLDNENYVLEENYVFDILTVLVSFVCSTCIGICSYYPEMTRGTRGMRSFVTSWRQFVYRFWGYARESANIPTFRATFRIFAFPTGLTVMILRSYWGARNFAKAGTHDDLNVSIPTTLANCRKCTKCCRKDRLW